MDETSPAPYVGGNRLIDSLPSADRDEVTAHLTMMTADEGSGGISHGDRITGVYLPIDAVFSVLVELIGGECYEVDSIGRGGLIGAELLLGAEVASRSVICQIAGRFAQMPVEAFERCLASKPSFAIEVHRAALLQSFRAQQTIACNFAHTLVQRCARWTLLSHDAVGRPEFPLRAEYVSMMLGVQPHVVSEPMAVLQGFGGLRYAGDVVSIVSERRLRDAVCECYTAPADYAKRLAIPRARRELQ